MLQYRQLKFENSWVKPLLLLEKVQKRLKCYGLSPYFRELNYKQGYEKLSKVK